MSDRIRALAKCKAGSEHIVIGRVENKQGVPFTSKEEAVRHLTSNEWTDIRFEIDREIVGDKVITLWSDQRKTEHEVGSSSFKYLERPKD